MVIFQQCSMGKPGPSYAVSPVLKGSFVFLVISTYLALLIRRNLPECQSHYSELKLYIAVICQKEGCDRGVELYDSWILDFQRRFPNSLVRFFVPGKPNKSIHDLIVEEQYSHDYYDILHFTLSAAADFLDYKEYDWHFRTTYDTFVSTTNLKHLIDNLSLTYNPQTDKVFKGQLLWHCPTAFFVHGGPGWIMSRKMVEIVMSRADYLRKPHDAGDDVVFASLAPMYNISSQSISTDLFVGPPITDKVKDYLSDGIETAFPICNTISVHNHSDFPQRIRNIVAWHSGRADNFPVRHGASVLETVAENLFFILGPDYSTEICYVSENNQLPNHIYYSPP